MLHYLYDLENYMNFKLINKKDGALLTTGSKQELMHFIKCRKLDRLAVTIEKFDDEPSYHTTVPITEDTPPKPGFFKRVFGK